MVTQHPSAQVQSAPTTTRHPLDPLSAGEVEEAVAVIREERSLDEKMRFESIVLKEPPKDLVLNFKDGDVVTREAFTVLFDNDTGAT